MTGLDKTVKACSLSNVKARRIDFKVEEDRTMITRR
jgi:hypothetical protein